MTTLEEAATQSPPPPPKHPPYKRELIPELIFALWSFTDAGNSRHQ